MGAGVAGAAGLSKLNPPDPDVAEEVEAVPNAYGGGAVVVVAGAVESFVVVDAVFCPALKEKPPSGFPEIK